MSIATIEQVKTWMGAEYATLDAAQVQMWLDALEAEIESEIPDFQTRLTNPLYIQTVRSIELSAVERKLKNPEGYASESVDNVALSYRASAASGTLILTDREWARLGKSMDLGAIRVTPGAPSLADVPVDWCDGWIGSPSDPEWSQAWPY